MTYFTKKSLHMSLPDFIKEVEKRESLWSTKHKNDKYRKAQDWMDLVRTMSKDDWDSWTKEEKDDMIEYAQKKWRSIRDNIVKQVRRQEKTDLGCPQQRKAQYVYFDICKFLLPEIPTYGRSFVWTKMNKYIQNKQKGKQNIKEEANTSSSDDAFDASDPLAMYDNFDTDSDDAPLSKSARKADPPRNKSSVASKATAASLANTRNTNKSNVSLKSGPSASSSSTKIDILPNEKSIPSESSPKKSKASVKEGAALNEDEAFFLSLMPSVQKLSEEQKMEFRISVLKLLKNLKQNANTNCTNAIVEELFNL